MSVAIFLIHRVATNLNNRWSLSIEPCEFEKFVTALSGSGALLALPDALSAEAAKDGKMYYALTFDDAYNDLRQYAFPILQRLHAPATLFLPTRYVMDDLPFWWETLSWLERQPYELDRIANLWGWSLASSAEATIDHWCSKIKGMPPEKRDPLIETIRVPPSLPRAISVGDLGCIPETIQIECHGHTHTVLSALTMQQVQAELRLSCNLIESWTGKRPRIFAYPNGQLADFTSEHVCLLEQSGLTQALTTISGIFSNRVDLFAIPRICVKPGYALQQLDELSIL